MGSRIVNALWLIAVDPHRGGSISLRPVAQVLVEAFGIGLRRYPVNPWGAGLPRVAICLAQEVLVDQVGQGRKDPIGIAGGLRRNPLEFWCDGW